jgi:hypothetical protein
MQIQLKYLAEEMQAVSKGLEKVVQELTASENDGLVSNNFCKVLCVLAAYVFIHVNEVSLHMLLYDFPALMDALL